MTITNAFSVDVEDYFHVEAFAGTLDPAQWDRMPYRAERNTRAMLELLARHSVRATFFVLGWIARRSPALVREIQGAGHEIACHGMTHRVVYGQSRETFRRETQEAKQRLEDATGTAVRGYRAATYSVFEYDSSIFPIHHDLYGIPDAPRFRFRPEGSRLLEIPITTVEWMGRRLPCGGGGYFRLLPYALFRSGLRRVNRRDGEPGVFYCHPWEIDPDQPRIAGAPWKSRLRHYTNLRRMRRKLDRLLADFRWGRMDEVFIGG
jgi:polysaccharide deacetylase family protein (PEP-CTERM system associated)